MCCVSFLIFCVNLLVFLVFLFLYATIFPTLCQNKNNFFVFLRPHSFCAWPKKKITPSYTLSLSHSLFFPGISCVTASRPWGEQCPLPWLSSPSPTLASTSWTPSANFLTMLTQRCLITPSLPWAWWAAVSLIEGQEYSDVQTDWAFLLLICPDFSARVGFKKKKKKFKQCFRNKNLTIKIIFSELSRTLFSHGCVIRLKDETGHLPSFQSYLNKIKFCKKMFCFCQQTDCLFFSCLFKILNSSLPLLHIAKFYS